MQRLLTDKLIEWKDNPFRKPLILRGVRHCGKTHLLKEFGASFFNHVYYFNLSKDLYIADLIGQNMNSARFIKDLSIYLEKDIDPSASLIIFDEIHACPKLLNALSSFADTDGNYHITAASSYLDVTLPRGTSIPFDNADILTLYPMNFFEFLMAQSPMLANHLRESGFRNDSYKTFKTQLEEKYRDYQIIGGMPAVVQSWIDTKSIDNVNKLLYQILKSLENDFSRYCSKSMLPKVIEVWKSIPAQLIKGNRKFMFTKVKKSWRGKDLDDAVYWLMRTGLIHKVTHIEKPALPVSGYADPAFFKLYMCDPGLLRSLGQFPTQMILGSDSGSKAIKSAVAETIVCNELVRIFERDLYYWSAEHPGKAEVDFIVHSYDQLIPVEVKAGGAGRARSLLQYKIRFNPKMSVLTGMDNDKDDILPLYAFWNLTEWLAD